MISFKFWKSRSEEEIRAAARAEGWRSCEEHFLAELTAQRIRFSDQAKIDEEKHKREMDNQRILDEKRKQAELKKVSDKAREIIKVLKTQVYEKDKRIEETQEAWRVFKDFMPDAIRLSNILKIRAEISQKNAIEHWRDASAFEDDFEALGRKVKSMTPHIEFLLDELEDKRK